MENWAWQAFADASWAHRDPADVDVAFVTGEVRHDAELDRLCAAGRDLSSRWDVDRDHRPACHKTVVMVMVGG